MWKLSERNKYHEVMLLGLGCEGWVELKKKVEIRQHFKWEE
jgi:hypothetical protein